LCTENLQTTPIAISVISGALLESRNLDNVTDLGAFVPNAVIQPLGAGWGATMAAFIRGVGLGDNILSFEPGVPIYVDDVYIGRPQGCMVAIRTAARRGDRGDGRRAGGSASARWKGGRPCRSSTASDPQNGRRILS